MLATPGQISQGFNLDIGRPYNGTFGREQLRCCPSNSLACGRDKYRLIAESSGQHGRAAVGVHCRSAWVIDRTDLIEALIRQDKFPMAECFRLGLCASNNFLYEFNDLGSDDIECGGAVENSSSVHVHVVLHSAISLWIASNLNHRRDGRAHYRAAAGGEQSNVVATSHKLRNLGVVGNVRKAKLRGAFRNDVEQIETGALRMLGRSYYAADGSTPRFHVSSGRLLFLR